MLRDFDTELDKAGVVKMTVSTSVPVVTEEVRVSSSLSHGRTWEAQSGEWTWEGLRDYVVHNIEVRFGPFPRNPRTEHSIWKSFITRWGPSTAERIARYTFEVCDGRWAGAPVSINRFCKGSDPFFAAVIAQRLSDTPINGW